MNKQRFLLSLIFPCYNEEKNLDPLLEAVCAELEGFELELVFVDDGSIDETLGVLRKIAARDSRVKYVSFSRNFGHQAALRCGLEICQGDCCVVLDADLQHPVRVVKTLVEHWEQGSKIVRTIRLDKGAESLFKRQTSRWFYELMNRLGLRGLKPGMADFYLLDREIIDILKERMKESGLFLRGMLAWIGFEAAEVTYIPDKRLHGLSKYNLVSMLRLAFTGITAFTTIPLVISGALGAFFLVLCGIYMLYVLYVHFVTGSTVPGWSSLMIVTLGCNGATLISLAILGQYIGLAYLEGKGRPHYLVKERSFSQD
ncbi:MAG: glycosyltransferase family 2 protein [Vulcanimicrobiota bacterium]